MTVAFHFLNGHSFSAFIFLFFLLVLVYSHPVSLGFNPLLFSLPSHRTSFYCVSILRSLGAHLVMVLSPAPGSRLNAADDGLIPAENAHHSQAYITGQDLGPPSAARPDKVSARTLRIRGLAPDTNEDIENALRMFLVDKLERQGAVGDLTIVPSCDPNDRNLEALVDFYPKIPKFLLDSTGKMPERAVCRFNGRKIEFDGHFHGFTQLFNTEPPNQANAE